MCVRTIHYFEREKKTGNSKFWKNFDRFRAVVVVVLCNNDRLVGSTVSVKNAKSYKKLQNFSFLF